MSTCLVTTMEPARVQGPEAIYLVGHRDCLSTASVWSYGEQLTIQECDTLRFRSFAVAFAG